MDKRSPKRSKPWHSSMLMLAFFLSFTLTTDYFAKKPLRVVENDLDVHFPIPVQLVMALGDRYLASNAGTLRATLIGGGKLGNKAALLALVQQDAAWFNPGQEDNYYLATANLPWEGQVDEAQTVLRRAAAGRPSDPYPLFYYGFNQQYFLGDYMGAARALEKAALRVEGNDRSMLLNMAAKWYERIDNPAIAIAMITDLKRKSQNPELTEYLQMRLQRVQLLEKLRAAARTYQSKTGRPLRQLEDLQREGIVSVLPKDPLGSGFVVKKGDVVVKRK